MVQVKTNVVLTVCGNNWKNYWQRSEYLETLSWVARTNLQSIWCDLKNTGPTVKLRLWFVFKKLLRSIKVHILQLFCMYLMCILYLTLILCENGFNSCWPQSDFIAMNRLSAAIEVTASVLLFRMEAIWPNWHQRDLMKALTFVPFSNNYADSLVWL